MILESTALSAVGRRSSNQDSILTGGDVLCGCDFLVRRKSFSADGNKTAFAIADGAGGEDAGDLASRTALNLLSEKLKLLPDKNYPDKIKEYIDEIQEKILNMFEEKNAFGGTTLSILLIAENRFFVFNLGDSPVYLIRENELTKLSREHTVAREKIDGGYSLKEIKKSDYHCITQSIGSGGYQEVSENGGELRGGDRFIVASDGLLLAFSEKKLKKILQKNSKGLLNPRNYDKINDNSSFIIVDVKQ